MSAMDNDVRQLSLHRDPRGLRDRMFPPQPERWVWLPCLAAFLFIYLFKFFFFEYRSDIEEGASVAANHSLGKHFGACLPFHLDSSWCTIHLCMCVCAYVHMCLQGLHLGLQLVALPAVPGFFCRCWGSELRSACKHLTHQAISSGLGFVFK